MGLLLFIQKIPRLGIFVVMFTDILKTFGQFFIVFAFFIFGFSLAFTILIGNQVRFVRYFASSKTNTGVIFLKIVAIEKEIYCKINLKFKERCLIFQSALR